jgi:hypothetical protein
MGGGRRDIERDARERLGQETRTTVKLLRRSETTFDATLDYLVSRAWGSSDRLLDARDQLGQQDAEARALLLRASRRAADPVPPQPPRPFASPDAPRR